MDGLNFLQSIPGLIKKHRYALAIVAVGIVLMLFPMSADKKEAEPVQQPATQQTRELSKQLEQILSEVKGAGEVRVLLSEAKSRRSVYQADEDRSADGALRLETVIVTDSARNQSALTVQTLSAEYQGAVVVCQGADRPEVRLAIVEAVSKATGLGADRISVLSMKGQEESQ